MEHPWARAGLESFITTSLWGLYEGPGRKDAVQAVTFVLPLLIMAPSLKAIHAEISHHPMISAAMQCRWNQAVKISFIFIHAFIKYLYNKGTDTGLIKQKMGSLGTFIRAHWEGPSDSMAVKISYICLSISYKSLVQRLRLGVTCWQGKYDKSNGFKNIKSKILKTLTFFKTTNKIFLQWSVKLSWSSCQLTTQAVNLYSCSCKMIYYLFILKSKQFTMK